MARLRLVSLMALQGLTRNPVLSMATLAMMGLSVFMVNIVLALHTLVGGTVTELQSQVDLLVYLKEEAGLYEVNQAILELEKDDRVRDVVYVSKEEALQKFLTDNPETEGVIQKLGIENPLPAYLQIFAIDPLAHGELAESLKTGPQRDLFLSVQSGDRQTAVITQLLRIAHFTRQLSIGVLTVFLAGTALLVAEAVHLSIFSRKTELKIMHMVGADLNMIQLPFIFEGIFYGIGAVILGSLLLVSFMTITGLESVSVVQENFEWVRILGSELIGSLVISALVSWITVDHYLNHYTNA